MSTDQFLDLFGARDAHEPSDPMKAAQKGQRASLPKRFYKDVTLLATGNGFALQLDGKTARTPSRNLLAVTDANIATRLMQEWDSQTDTIEPATMPLTRLVNSALDGVAKEMDAVRGEIIRYATSDLICYRAETPQELAALQAEMWDPLIDWARQNLNLPILIGTGVIHVAQPADVIEQANDHVTRWDLPLELAALSAVTTLTGSAIIALALAKGRLTEDQAWLAAHVDEDYQTRVWGSDDEAVFRQGNRRRDFNAAALVLSNAAYRTG